MNCGVLMMTKAKKNNDTIGLVLMDEVDRTGKPKKREVKLADFYAGIGKKKVDGRDKNDKK